MPVLQKPTQTAIIASTNAATAEPVSGDTGYVSNADGGMIRLSVRKESGTISALSIRIYYRDADNGWSAGDVATIDTTLLAAKGRLAIDMFAGEESEFRCGFETLSGGGNASLYARAVQA